MKNKILWVGFLGAGPAMVLPAAETINGAGATFPDPIYQKWFEEYHKAASRHPDQLPVDRFGRRHPAAHRRHRGFRRLRHAHDRRADQGHHQVSHVLHFPTVLGGVVPTYNIPGVSRRPEVHSRSAGRHLPGQDHQMERSGAARRTTPASNCPTTTSSWCTAPTAAAPPSSGPTISPKSARNGRPKWAPTLR